MYSSIMRFLSSAVSKLNIQFVANSLARVDRNQHFGLAYLTTQEKEWKYNLLLKPNSNPPLFNWFSCFVILAHRGKLSWSLVNVIKRQTLSMLTLLISLVFTVLGGFKLCQQDLFLWIVTPKNTISVFHQMERVFWCQNVPVWFPSTADNLAPGWQRDQWQELLWNVSKNGKLCGLMASDHTNVLPHGCHLCCWVCCFPCFFRLILSRNGSDFNTKL